MTTFLEMFTEMGRIGGLLLLLIAMGIGAFTWWDFQTTGSFFIAAPPVALLFLVFGFALLVRGNPNARRKVVRPELTPELVAELSSHPGIPLGEADALRLVEGMDVEAETDGIADTGTHRARQPAQLRTFGAGEACRSGPGGFWWKGGRVCSVVFFPQGQIRTAAAFSRGWRGLLRRQFGLRTLPCASPATRWGSRTSDLALC